MTAIKASLRNWVYGGGQGFLLLILCIYTFIPFETATEGFALQIRSAVAVLLAGYVIVSAKWRLDRTTFSIVLLIFSMVVLASIVSTSGRVFIQVIAVLLGALISCATRDDTRFRANFVLALELLLVFSSLALLVQVVIWKGTGEIVKIHEIVFPLSEARVEDHGFVARMGGIYIEPGTFSNWTCLLVLIYRLLVDKAKHWLMFLVGGAMVASLSAWGVAAGLVILLVSAAGSLRKSWLATIPLVIVAGIGIPLLISSDVLEFLENKSELESDSGDSKVMAINEFFRIFDDIFFLGHGFSSDFCRACLAPQDAGVFIGLSIVFGFVFSAIIFGCFYYKVFQKLGMAGVFIGAFVVFSKVFYWDFVLWVLFFLAWRSRPNKDFGMN